MKLRSRTRQKTNLKNVIIVGTSFCLLLAAGIFITINVSDVKESKAASTGDFRSMQSGNWNDAAVWERYNGSDWETSDGAPIDAAANVSISANTIVSLYSEITIANLDIQKSAKLVLKTPVLKVQKNGAKSAVNVDGILDAGTCIISGSASFNLKAGATIAIGSPQGIKASGKQGNIQVEGIRSFSRKANYTYSGTEMQLTGNGIPSSVNALVIDTPEGVKLENSLHILKTLELKKGILFTGDKNLTLGWDIANVGVLTRESGYINGNFRRWMGIDNMEEALFPMNDGITYHAFYFKASHKEFDGGLFTLNFIAEKKENAFDQSPDSRVIAVGESGYYLATGNEGFSSLSFKLTSTIAVSKTESKNYWTIKYKEPEEKSRIESNNLLSGGINNVSIRPNPFTSNFQMHFNLNQSAETTIEIFSVNGQRIHVEKFMGQENQNIFEFSQSDKMIAGTYFVNVTALGKTESVKIIKK